LGSAAKRSPGTQPTSRIRAGARPGCSAAHDFGPPRVTARTDLAEQKLARPAGDAVPSHHRPTHRPRPEIRRAPVRVPCRRAHGDDAPRGPARHARSHRAAPPASGRRGRSPRRRGTARSAGPSHAAPDPRAHGGRPRLCGRHRRDGTLAHQPIAGDAGDARPAACRPSSWMPSMQAAFGGASVELADAASRTAAAQRM
jgi:hypothetical protein